MEYSAVPDWSGLLPELVLEIATKITVLIDFMRFRAVCTAWRAAAGKDKFRYSKVPVLILLEDKGGRRVDRLVCSLSDGKFFSAPLFPEPKGKRWIPAGFGWIMAIHRRGNSPVDITLFKPFWRTKFDLPKARISELETMQVLLSADPSKVTGGFVVMVFFHENQTQKVMSWKNGHENWICATAWSFIDSTCYCNGKFYSIDHSNQNIWVRDPHGSDPTLATLVLRVQGMFRSFGMMTYLLESSDSELLIIGQHIYEETPFRLYRLNLKKREWKRIHSLGEEAVFLGDNAAISVNAADFPGVVRSNCIYFNCGKYDWSYTISVYNVEDKSLDWIRLNVKFAVPKSPMWFVLE